VKEGSGSLNKEEIDVAFRSFHCGIYRHYKGGLYRALALVAHHDTREPWVLYVSLKQGSVNIRPLLGADGWRDLVPRDNGEVPRFILCDDTLDGLDGTEGRSSTP